MTVDQASIRLNELGQKLRNDFPNWANAALGNTALAMIQKRVIDTGVSSDGSAYKPYSTKPTLVGAKSFRTKAAASSVFGTPAKRKALEWRRINRGGTYYNLAILPGGYKQIRQIDGSQVNHKSFLRTGEMWQSIHTLGTDTEGQGFVTRIGTKVDLSNKKLSGNTEREGKDILMVSKQEEQKLAQILDKYIQNVINSSLNG